MSKTELGAVSGGYDRRAVEQAYEVGGFGGAFCEDARQTIATNAATLEALRGEQTSMQWLRGGFEAALNQRYSDPINADIDRLLRSTASAERTAAERCPSYDARLESLAAEAEDSGTPARELSTSDERDVAVATAATPPATDDGEQALE